MSTQRPIAFVSGASSGIGQACAEVLAREGYDLILAARRSERLQDLAMALEAAYGTQVFCCMLDVRDKDAVQNAIGSFRGRWKHIDVLINNAGLSQGLDPIQTGDTGDWDRMIDTNVKGLLYMTRAVVPLMIEQGKGHVVNIGSIAAKEVYPNGNVYCATKHAVDALTQGMRVDLLHEGIKVTAIHPGMVETEFSEVRFKGDRDRAKAVYHNIEPLVAMDVAEAVWFAVSRPAHVNINDMLIMPTAQASGTQLVRREKG